MRDQAVSDVLAELGDDATPELAAWVVTERARLAAFGAANLAASEEAWAAYEAGTPVVIDPDTGEATYPEPDTHEDA